MKTLNSLIALLLISQAALSSNELSWVDTQVDAIKPSRVGISNADISRVKNPFVFYKKEISKKDSKKSSIIKKASTKSSTTSRKKSSKPKKLSAIINNSALIDGDWYRVDQSVAGFTISSITRTSVVLTRGKQKLVLTTNDQKRNLKFK